MKKNLIPFLLAVSFVVFPVYAAKPAKVMSREELGKVLTCQIERSPDAIKKALSQHGKQVKNDINVADYVFTQPLVIDGITITRADISASGDFGESLELFSRSNNSVEQVKQKLKWKGQPQKNSNMNGYSGAGRVGGLSVYVPFEEKYTRIECAREN